MKLFVRTGAVLGALAVLSGAVMAQTPGRNAFLETSVKSTDQLIAQVKRDRKIRDSYLRHFAMNETELYTYLRTLRPVRLERDTVFTIYSVPPGGELKAHDERLRKGELLFVDAEGRPVLRARCGNPLVKETVSAVPGPEVVSAGPMERPLDVPEAMIVPVAPLALQPAPPIVPELVVIEETPPVVVTPGAAPQSFPLPALLALPLIGGNLGGDGGGENPPPVPEPATMLALAAGAGALVARRRKK